MDASAERIAAGRPALRADAERNRQRIVAAARELFAERGIDVPMDDVAREAGVGIATLYRRFPTRAELVVAAFEWKMAAYADAVTRALTHDEPWTAFCEYVETVCAMQAADQGFCDVLTLTFPTFERFEAERIRAYDGFVELIARAKAAGRLRADFVPEDLVVLLMANAGVINATSGTAPDAWRRLVAYMLQAFAADASAPLPPPPSPRHLYQALLRLQLPDAGA